MNSSWYVLHSNYRKEDSLYHLLLSKGFEVYYPTLKVDPVNPRAKTERPYFPQYLFVNSNIENAGEKIFERLPYVISLVKFGGVPATVPQRMIEQLRNKIDQVNNRIKTEKEFSGGDPVQVVEGPFAGYEGLFNKSMSGEQRVQVLLTFLNDKKLRLEISETAIIKKENGEGLVKGQRGKQS